MTNYAFKIGQMVQYEGRIPRARGVYQITQRMPVGEDGESKYGIKRASENHERVAGESELNSAYP